MSFAVVGSPRRPHQRAIDSLQVAGSGKTQGDAQLALQKLDDSLYTGLAKGRQAPKIGPSNHDCLRAEGQRFDDIAPAAYATINEHRDLAINGIDNLR